MGYKYIFQVVQKLLSVEITVENATCVIKVKNKKGANQSDWVCEGKSTT